jgi:hypothetical protein
LVLEVLEVAQMHRVFRDLILFSAQLLLLVAVAVVGQARILVLMVDQAVVRLVAYLQREQGIPQ